MFLKNRVIDGEYIVKISRGIVKYVSKVVPFQFVKELDDLLLQLTVVSRSAIVV